MTTQIKPPSDLPRGLRGKARAIAMVQHQQDWITSWARKPAGHPAESGTKERTMTATKTAKKPAAKKTPKAAKAKGKKTPKAKAAAPRKARERDPNKVGLSHLHILRALQANRKGLTASEIMAALPKKVCLGIYLWSKNPEVAAAWEATRGKSAVGLKLVKPQDDEERGVVYHITDLGRDAIKKNKDK